MILASNLHKMVEKGTFAFAFVEASGNIVKVNVAICTSWHSKGRTMNVKLIPSCEIRTINRSTIIEYNDEEVCL